MKNLMNTQATSPRSRDWRTATATFALTIFACMLVAPQMANAAAKLCGREWAKPTDMQKILSETEKLPEVHRDQYYVAFQDEKAQTMWTFTLPGTLAHPTVVCRKPVKEGEMMRLHMDINCNGDQRACDALVRDFKKLNSQMAKQMNKPR